MEFNEQLQKIIETMLSHGVISPNGCLITGLAEIGVQGLHCQVQLIIEPRRNNFVGENETVFRIDDDNDIDIEWPSISNN